MLRPCVAATALLVVAACGAEAPAALVTAADPPPAVVLLDDTRPPFGPVATTTTTVPPPPPTTTTTAPPPAPPTTVPAPPPPEPVRTAGEGTGDPDDPASWQRLYECENGGHGWGANTGNGYYGGLQFSLGTWESVGGQGYPHEASPAEQIRRGQILQARSGWGQWPWCTRSFGWR